MTRDRLVQVRVSTEELALIRAGAEQAGRSVSAWLRGLALDEAPFVPSGPLPDVGDSVQKARVAPEVVRACPLSMCPTKSSTLKRCPIHGHKLV